MTYTSDPSKGNSQQIETQQTETQQIETQQTETQQTETPPSSSTHPSASFINRKKRTPIVGLVGAAGCRHALEMFFRNLPEDSGMTFVISTRLGSRILNNLPAVLQRRTTMEVVIAADGATLQADHIYLAPAGVQMTIKQGKLSLQAPMAKRDSVDDEPDDDDATERAPNNAAANGQADEAMGVLDRFLVSLAQVQDQDFAAILLSGTGTDGVTGFKAVQEAGGLTLIQDPDEAAHGALPRRAMAACEKATVASAGELARRLIQAKGDLADGSAVVQTDTVESFDELYTAILEQVAMHTGHNLSHYKVSTMRRRIARRMSMTGVASLPQYIVLLQRNTAEAHALFQDALVSVTSFFRDPDAYDMLEQDCIPQLFAEKGGSDNVRVWVVGCATGQEAYSVAMQLVEYAAQVGEPPRLQVFATDLDEAAIAVARRGIYPRSIAEEIAPTRLERFFSHEEHGYRVKPEIREHVLFAVHDLLKDPPFSNLDLITCRNVLIYFNREAQAKVFEIFHYALNRARVGREYLFLGTSESVDAALELFAVVDKYCHLYQRRDIVSTARQRQLPAPPTLLSERAQERARDNPVKPTRTLEELYTNWSLRVHTPPRLLVNSHYEITHLFGDTRRYLQEPQGAVTQNILQRILPDLRLDLRTALYQAFHKQERTISRALSVEIEGKVHLTHLHVGPITEPGFPEGYVEVVFVAEEGTDVLELSSNGEAVATDMALVMRMEEELIRTRERLQTVIEEYENSSQELKTSNEELQSINEELKSTTEELETSKEELQSMNEELVTVNGELTDKVEELNQANSDLLNLIASTDVGTIFLNADLRLSRFTPRALDLFNLIEGDLGRPFAHVTHRIRHSNLAELAANVRDSAERIEETVQDESDNWYILRLFPYRTVTGKFNGVVVSFVDISDLKRAESEERQRIQQQMLAALGRQALISNNLDELLQTAAEQTVKVLGLEFCKILELRPNGKEMLLRAGVGWHEGLVGQTLVPADTHSQAGYTLQILEPVIVRDIRTETRFQSPTLLLEHGVRSGMTVTIYGPNGPFGALGVHRRTPGNFATSDIDFLQAVANTLAAAIARHRTAVELRDSEATMRRYVNMLQASYDAIIIWSPQQGIEFWNHGAEELYGYRADEAIGQSTHELLSTRHPQPISEIMNTLEKEGRWEGELIHRTKDGQTVHVSTRHQRMEGVQDGHVILEINRDITAAKGAEVALRQSEEMVRRHLDELEAIYNTAPIGLCVLDTELRWVRINERLAEINGYSVADHIGRTVRELLPDIAGEAEPILRHVLATGEPVLNVELTGETPAQPGVQRSWIESWFPMRDGEGNLIGINIVTQEVTERKAMEEALRNSEATARRHLDELEAIYNTAPVGLCVMDRELRYVRINERLAAMNGLSAAAHLGRAGRDLLPDLAEKTERALLAIFHTGEPVIGIEVTGEIPSEPGVQHTWVESWLPLHNEAGEVEAINIVVEEITERKRIEEELRYQAFLLENVQDAILSTDIDLYIRSWNRGAELIYGWTAAEAIGQRVHELLATRYLDGSSSPESIVNTLKTEGYWKGEVIHHHHDGTQLFISNTTTVLHDEAGEPTGAVAVNRNITERKLAEERLHFLARASALLNDSLNYRETLENVAQFAVPEMADWCVIDLVEADGSIQDAALAHIDPEQVQWAKKLREQYPVPPDAPSGAPHVIRTGVSELYAEITDELLQAVAKNEEELRLLRSVGYRSVMIVPLQTHDAILGAISFVASDHHRPYNEQDLTMAEELASRAASAIHNAQLHNTILQREQLLGVSEERLRLATTAGSIGIFDYELTTGRINYSDIYRAIAGIDESSMLTLEEWLARVAPEDRPMLEEKVQRARALGESYRADYRIIHPDGTVHWVSDSALVTTDSAGRGVRITGAMRDVTARRLASEALRRSEALFRAVQQATPDGFMIFESVRDENDVIADFRWLYVNPAAERLIGRPHADLVGKLLLEEMPGNREEGLFDAYVQVVESGDVWQHEFIYRHDGLDNWFRSTAAKTGDGFAVAFTDISPNKAAEEALRRSEVRFRSAFEQAAVGMAHLDIEGRYLRVNDRLCDILGYTREELLAKSFMEITHPADLEEDLTQMMRQLRGELPHHIMEKRYLRKDGTYIWANMTASVVFNEVGEPQYGIVVIEDISSRKAAEQALHELTTTLEERVAARTAELERSNQELDQFAYVASHDLRAPLRGINHLVDWIGEDTGEILPPASQKHFATLRGRVHRMEQLLEDLLIYSRAGRQQTPVELVDSSALVARLIDLLQPEPPFTVTIDPALPTFRTQRVPLELVLRNLINNAIKHHHRADGHVWVTAREMDDGVEFTVQDDGPGIDPAFHERIFQIFQTLQPRDEVEGSGMGLAVVKKTVEAVGGKIWVESAEGEGATFRFTWPKPATT